MGSACVTRPLQLGWHDTLPHGLEHVTACHRFEEGMGVDQAIRRLVPEAGRDPQLRPQHVLLVKTAFRQMLEVRCKTLSHVCLPEGNWHKHDMLMLVAPSPSDLLITSSQMIASSGWHTLLACASLVLTCCVLN